MLLGEGGPHELGGQKGYPLKKRYSTIVGSSNVRGNLSKAHVTRNSSDPATSAISVGLQQ